MKKPNLIGISGHIGSGKDTVAKMIQYHISCKHFNISQEQEPFRNDSSRNYSTGGWEVKKFAGKLKQIVSLLTGIPATDLEYQSVKDSFLGQEWDRVATTLPVGSTRELKENQYWDKQFESHPKALPYWAIMQKVTVRELLQKLGTDAMRDIIHPNIHINALFVDWRTNFEAKNVEEWGKNLQQNWLIPDLRFPNELEAIKEREGVTLRVNRKYDRGKPEFLAGHIVFEKPPQVLHPSETALDSATFDYVIENNGTLEELLAKVGEFCKQFNLI